MSAWSKALMGAPDLVVERAMRALRLSPQDWQTFAMKSAVGIGHYMTGNHEEAYRWAETGLREQPSFYIAACTMAASAVELGRMDDAAKSMAHVRRINPELRISNIHEATNFQRPEDIARWKEDLAKAGLPA